MYSKSENLIYSKWKPKWWQNGENIIHEVSRAILNIGKYHSKHIIILLIKNKKNIKECSIQ